MRNIRKSSTLESKFPLLAVEQGCIISKDADITVAYEVTLPEIFTVTSQEYEAVHAAWCKAIKVLPDYSIVHKQDWFVKENYKPDLLKSDMSFLSRSYERHFNERPYLHHQCYLFLTKTTKERMAHQSNFSTLCRGHIIPKEIKDKEMVARFLDAVEQFARIINDSGYISLRKLTDDEITGTERTTGLVGKYLSLSTENVQCLEDMELSASGMRIGNKHLCLHTLSQTEDLPTEVSTDNRFERLSTDRSDCRLSFAAPVGLLLSCNHIYNQYVFIDNSDETLQKFEKTARNMHSLSRYSRQNAINKEWIDEYLNEAHSQGLQSVRAHFNVLAWGEDMEELKHLRNDVGSQLASMECVPRHNTVDCPTLFWAAIPGNEGDFPSEESFHTFIEQATCLFTEETNYMDSPSPFGIKMADRISGKPLHIDISDLPMRKGVTTNRHKFNDRIDAYAAWVYRSGDRATVPNQYVNGPSFPGIPDSGEPELVYEKPNNITLPAYHRLDLGVNFRRTTKRGFERIWNVSIYNAYCRMNAFYTRIERLPDGGFRGKGFGIFPIIPSFSYTLKF